MVIPSTPGAPLFARTLWYAFTRFSRRSTSSSSIVVPGRDDPSTAADAWRSLPVSEEVPSLPFRESSGISTFLSASFSSVKVSVPSALSCSGLPFLHEGTMPSADFCLGILPPHDGSSPFGHTDRSPRVLRTDFPPTYPSHLHPSLPDDYRASNLYAFSPRDRCPGTRLRVMRFVYLGPGVYLPLPSDPASRWQPLRFGSWFPSSGSTEDFHLRVSAPCRAHVIKKPLFFKGF